MLANSRLDGRAGAALCSALVPLLVILVQAGVYWLSARTWVMRAPMPATIAAVIGQGRSPRLVKDLRSSHR